MFMDSRRQPLSPPLSLADSPGKRTCICCKDAVTAMMEQGKIGIGLSIWVLLGGGGRRTDLFFWSSDPVVCFSFSLLFAWCFPLLLLAKYSGRLERRKRRRRSERACVWWMRVGPRDQGSSSFCPSFFGNVPRVAGGGGGGDYSRKSSSSSDHNNKGGRQRKSVTNVLR